MDPLSITAACLAVSRAAVSTGVELHNVITRMKDAPQIMQSVRLQVKMTEQITKRLYDWLEIDAHVLTEDEVHTLKLSVLECQSLMVRIKQHVDTPAGERSMGFFKRAKHVWNEAALKEDSDRLKTQLSAQQQLIDFISL